MSIAYRLPYTYDDYKKWEGDWELIGGEAVAMAPSPFGPHQSLLLSIGTDIKSSFNNCKKKCFVYAELDYVVDKFNIFRPDISIMREKVAKFINTPPKMVVEILSPKTAMKDKTIKYDTYEKEGVEFYLMVDYNLKQVKLYRLVDYKYRKIDDKEKGTMEVEINGCTVVFDLDEWWEVV